VPADAAPPPNGTDPLASSAQATDAVADRVVVARLADGSAVLRCGQTERGVWALAVDGHGEPGTPPLPTGDVGPAWYVSWPLDADLLPADTPLVTVARIAPQALDEVLVAIAGAAHAGGATAEAVHVATAVGAINRPRTDLARDLAGPADAFQVVRESRGHLQLQPGRVVGGEFTPMYDQPLLLSRSSDLAGWEDEPGCEGPAVVTAMLAEVPAPAVVAVLEPFLPADPARSLPWYLLTPDRRLRALSGRVPQQVTDVAAALTAWSFDPAARLGLADRTPVLVARVAPDVLQALAAAEESPAPQPIPAVGSLWQGSGNQFIAVTGHRRGGTLRLSRLTRPGTELVGSRTPGLCRRLGIDPDSLLVTLPGTGDWVRVGDLDVAVPEAQSPLPALLGEADLAMLRFATDPAGQHRSLPLGSVVTWRSPSGKPTIAVVAGHRSPDDTPRLEVEVMAPSTGPQASPLPGLSGTWEGSGAIASVAPDHLTGVIGYGAGEQTHVVRARLHPPTPPGGTG
jgi:hypothetical protein